MINIGTYRQETEGRQEVSGITRQSLRSVLMQDFESCKNAGKIIKNDIQTCLAIW